MEKQKNIHEAAEQLVSLKFKLEEVISANNIIFQHFEKNVEVEKDRAAILYNHPQTGSLFYLLLDITKNISEEIGGIVSVLDELRFKGEE